MNSAKNRVNLLTSEVPALTTVSSVRFSSETERYSKRATPAESSTQLKFPPRLRWDFHSKSTWTSSSTSFWCLALKWTQLELWNVIKTIEFSIHLYIYHRLNLHFNTTLHYNLFKHTFYIQLRQHTASDGVTFQHSSARWLTNALLSRPTFFVQRIPTSDAW